MPASLVLGGIGLSITIVDKSIKAIEFIIATINDAKTFGEHVLKLKTRLTSECARLYDFSTFLQQEDETGIKRLSTLPLISQDAVVGVIQELELLFWGYSTYLKNHNIEELQRGYTTSERLAEDAKQLSDRRKVERKGTQDRTSWWQATKCEGWPKSEKSWLWLNKLRSGTKDCGDCCCVDYASARNQASPTRSIKPCENPYFIFFAALISISCKLTLAQRRTTPLDWFKFLHTCQRAECWRSDPELDQDGRDLGERRFE